MGLFDKIKNLVNVDDDEFEEDVELEEEEAAPVRQQSASYYREPEPKRESAPRIFQTERKSKTVSFSQGQQMQVVLVKPDRFEDVTDIADHLCDKKTVVLNLESANREVSRRIIDFLSGVAYANKGNIKKVANSTFIIVPRDVDVAGELMFDDFDSSRYM